jgi:hypothetical protein
LFLFSRFVPIVARRHTPLDLRATQRFGRIADDLIGVRSVVSVAADEAGIGQGKIALKKVTPSGSKIRVPAAPVAGPLKSPAGSTLSGDASGDL